MPFSYQPIRNLLEIIIKKKNDKIGKLAISDVRHLTHKQINTNI